MKFSPNAAFETARVFEPLDDGHWQPGAELGSVRMELAERTAVSAAAAAGGAELAHVRLSIGRSFRSSLLRAGRIVSVRGRFFRIESVIEERDGLQQYHSLILKEVQ